MLAGRGVGPLARRAVAGVGTAQADVEAAPRGIPNIADPPVGAGSASVGEIVATGGLGVLGEPVSSITLSDGSSIMEFDGLPASGSCGL